MNFLAHLYLSGEPSELMVGNFIADSVKGSSVLNFSEGIQKGIKLHRSIDMYTDAHAIVQQSKERLRIRYKKYAPVISDIFYDHFLAVNWSKYSAISLKNYTTRIYSFLENYYAVFPERSKQFFQYMIRYDILYNYSNIAGIQKVLNGMSSRASFNSGMETSTEELDIYYSEFKSEFEQFFPDLQQHVNEFLQTND